MKIVGFFPKHKITLLNCEDDQALARVAQGVSGISICRDSETPVELSDGLCARADTALIKGLSQKSLEVPSILNHFWLCVIQSV